MILNDMVDEQIFSAKFSTYHFNWYCWLLSLTCQIAMISNVSVMLEIPTWNGANRFCRQLTHIRSIIIMHIIIFVCGFYMCSQQLNTWVNKFLMRYNGDFDSIAHLYCTKESPTKSHSSSFTYVCCMRMVFYLVFIQTFWKSSCTWAHLFWFFFFFSFRKVDLTFTRHIFNETNVKKLLKMGIISIWSTDMRS